MRRLALVDVAADLPIEADQRAVHGEGGTQPRRANPGFQIGEPGGAAGGRGGRFGRHRAAAPGAEPPLVAARPGGGTRGGRRVVMPSGLMGAAVSSMGCA